MKKNSFRTILFTLILLASLGVGLAQAQESGPASPAAVAADVGTAFTYQGQLSLDGAPVNGNCDFTFAIYDAEEDGNQICFPSADLDKTVTDGLFTSRVWIDTGSNLAAGARWLEIAVRCPAGSGDFTTLTPRQRIRPAPIAFALPGFYTEATTGTPNIIGGYSGNTVSAGVVGATISGGGVSNYFNTVTGEGGVVSGGADNAAGPHASVGGGFSNTASGFFATVPGGSYNSATGKDSFAAGNSASAGHEGTFVWNGRGATSMSSSKDSQFLIGTSGGVGINTNDTLASGLTVNGRIIAGGVATGIQGSEPFVSRGDYSGISMDDRENGAAQRWVIYPSGSILRFYTNFADRFSVSDTGVVYFGGVGTAGGTALCRNSSGQIAYCSSSARYKTNIAPLAMGLEVIAKLRPVTFDWKETGEADLGLVAEEVYEISPLLTTLNDEGQIEGVKYEQVSVVLVNAVQEQQAQIATLEESNAALEARLAALEGGTPLPAANNPLLPILLAVGGLLLLALGLLAGVLLAPRLGRRAAA
ncbi:MAG: tail fiber domain-containing protein [Anaerolineales bacterium]|nr:tail fiber domain-containing protein [Anaerolineales bacterium]